MQLSSRRELHLSIPSFASIMLAGRPIEIGT